jgi:glycerol dehydrogenase
MSNLSFFEVLDFCLTVGLPICLDDLGIHNPTREEIRKVADATMAPCETIHATWFEVTADKV